MIENKTLFKKYYNYSAIKKTKTWNTLGTDSIFPPISILFDDPSKDIEDMTKITEFINSIKDNNPYFKEIEEANYQTELKKLIEEFKKKPENTNKYSADFLQEIFGIQFAFGRKKSKRLSKKYSANKYQPIISSKKKN